MTVQPLGQIDYRRLFTLLQHKSLGINRDQIKPNMFEVQLYIQHVACVAGAKREGRKTTPATQAIQQVTV